MGGITSTRRAEVTALNFCKDDDLKPKKPLGSLVGAKAARGSHVFEISGYSLHRERPGECIRATSAVFAVGGYDWKIIFFPGAFQGCSEYVGAFLVLKSEDKGIRVRASFHLSLVDVTGSAPPYTMEGVNEFEPEISECSGCFAFKKRSDLEASPYYLHDDRLTIECAITVEDVKRLAEVPPSNITEEHLGKLSLQGKEDTDVTFEVEGEDFVGRNDYYETIRHLLVAADRYAIDSLKIRCESILCESIDA